MRALLLILALASPQFIFVVPPTSGYFVRTDGNNSNLGTSNSAGGAWQTIDYAIEHVAAGAVIRVQAGHYAERVTPAVSGTVGSPITIVADGSVSFCGMDVSSKDYIRVLGFTIDMNASGCSGNRAIDISGTNTGWEFWNNTFRDANYAGIAVGDYTSRHHNFIVIGNTFTNIGLGGNNGTAVSVRGNNNVFAYNDIDGVAADSFYVTGTSSYWLNNYTHNVVDPSDLHADQFQSDSSTLGLSFNTFEANRYIGNGTLPNEHGVLMQNINYGAGSSQPCGVSGVCGAITENLYRRNVWHNTDGVLGANEAGYASMSGIRFVQNTIADAARYQNSHAVNLDYSVVLYNNVGGNTVSGYIFNSVFYNAWTEDLISSGIKAFWASTNGIIAGADYNLAYTPDNTPTYTTPWTTQANALSNVNPSFSNFASDDFTLQSGSSARNAGGPLTTTSGSGTGTTFTVASGGGGFFRGPNNSITSYGGQLTAGDVITVGTDIVTVAGISTDVITVTSSFTWGHGENVYLGSSTTPDIGAFPYKTSYALTATYAVASDVVTTTPSDASLVRFVVCYLNGIPMGVDNTSPYTCARGSGTLVVRVYPLYAVATRYVEATP